MEVSVTINELFTMKKSSEEVIMPGYDEKLTENLLSPLIGDLASNKANS